MVRGRVRQDVQLCRRAPLRAGSGPTTTNGGRSGGQADGVGMFQHGILETHTRDSTSVANRFSASGYYFIFLSHILGVGHGHGIFLLLFVLVLAPSAVLVSGGAEEGVEYAQPHLNGPSQAKILKTWQQEASHLHWVACTGSSEVGYPLPHELPTRDAQGIDAATMPGAIYPVHLPRPPALAI